MLTPDSIQKVRSASIVDVVGHYIKLSKQYKASCPFHNEKSASFSVSPAKGIYKCFGCGEGGDAIQFVMKHQKLEFYDAVKAIADICGITLEEDAGFNKEAYIQKRQEQKSGRDLLQHAARVYHQALLNYQPLKGDTVDPLQYLQEHRGWNMDIINEWQLGYAPSNWRTLAGELAPAGRLSLGADVGLVTRKESQDHDTFFRKIMFPIHSEIGEVIGFGARVLDNSNPKYINSKGTDLYHKSSTLYGLYKAIPGIREAGFVILVEGYADVISMHMAGMANTVGVCGTSFTKEMAVLLKRYTDFVVIMPDNDTKEDGSSAGLSAAEKTLQVLLPYGFKTEIYELPVVDGKKQDPDDFARSIMADMVPETITEEI